MAVRRRGTFRLGLGLVAAVAGWALAPAASAEAASGFDTSLTALPGRFVAGGGAGTVTAVVATTRDDGCRRVRWSLLLRVTGADLGQVTVDRVEQTGSFPVWVRATGDRVRLTDRALDPGTLCRNRTVTARYRIAVAGGAPAGRIALTVEAYDAQGRLLAAAGATREVVGSRAGRNRSTPGPVPATPRVTSRPTPPPTRSPTVSAEVGPARSGRADDDDTAAGLANVDEPEAYDTAQAAGGRTATSARTGVEPPPLGFVVGGVLLLVGVGLLLRLWARVRATPAPAVPRRRGRSSSGRPYRVGDPRRAADVPDW